jgi:hypothetical protein
MFVLMTFSLLLREELSSRYYLALPHLKGEGKWQLFQAR